ncbi:flavin reductase family protein [Nocardia tengchongensis]|uniref:flavin reductase family protein n=1 Tax=Nocardia tengchongensis TaxID=2055889 RepID=UPI00369E2172
MLTVDEFPATTDELRQVYGCHPSGVVAVCALIGDEPVGMAVSSFTPVSLEPALVSVCMQQASTTWPRLRASGRLGISILAQGQESTCRSLSAKHGDRFSTSSWEPTSDGSVFIHGAAAWLDCSLYDEVQAGDHTIALLRIHGVQTSIGIDPLVFHSSSFRQLSTPHGLTLSGS